MNEPDYSDCDFLPTNYEKYWGIKIDKEREGDFSIGACITRDSWLGEFYLYINIVKWSICIGRLARLED